MRFAIALILLVVNFPVSMASEQAQIDSLLKTDSAPFGVVFEVVGGDEDALQWAIPRIKTYAAQLRKKFPDVGIAVVSHGKEQFALLTENTESQQEVHKTVQSLVKDDNIPVHVCGTHASWRDTAAKDFPDYVDVAPAGPTEIANYEDMGYILVVMRKR